MILNSGQKYTSIVAMNFIFWLSAIGTIIAIIILSIQLKYEYGNTLPPLFPPDSHYGDRIPKYGAASMLATYTVPLSIVCIILSSLLGGSTLSVCKLDFVKKEHKSKLKIYGILAFFFPIFVGIQIALIILEIDKETRQNNVPSNNINPPPYVMFNKNEENKSNMLNLEKMYDLYQKGCISKEEYEKYKDVILSDTFEKLK